MRVVLDTNVIISALLSPEGIPSAILDMATQGRIRAVFSEATFAELERVLARPKFGFSRRKVAVLKALLLSRSLKVSPSIPLALCPGDSSDNRFLEAAQESSAAYLVTGNASHFPNRHKTTRIVTPREFWEVCLGLQL